MTVAERRAAVRAAIWLGRTVQQVARILGVPVHTVVADVLAMRRNGVMLPRPETLWRAVEEVSG